MTELPSNPLRSELADRLDEVPIAQIIEYVAQRLLDGGEAQWVLEFELDKGKLRRGSFDHARVGVDEMERMGERRGERRDRG